MYGYVFQDPVNFIDPNGTDSYRTNYFGHGYLIIDNPNRAVGGSYVFSFSPKSASLMTYAMAALGKTLPAYASLVFVPKGTDLSEFGPEVPLSRIVQGPEADAQALKRAIDFVKNTRNRNYKFNGYNMGKNNYNCIGASRAVQ